MPSLVATKLYVRVSPSVTVPEPSSSAFDDKLFTRAIDGSCSTGTVSDHQIVTGGPVGGVPDAVAVLSTWPLSTSACVTDVVAEQVIVSVGAKLEPATGTHVNADKPGNGSVTDTFARVTVPSLVATKPYVRVSPRVTSPEPSSSAFDDKLFTNAIDGSCSTGTVSGSSIVTGGPVGGVPDAVAVLST